MSVDYLAIGHVTCDLAPDGNRLGGSVTFSVLTAQRFGMATALLTSAPSTAGELLAPLQHVPLEIIQAETFTTFENIYTAEGRIQTLSSYAGRLGAEHIPSAWHTARIVHLAPVANEIDPHIVDAFPNSFIGLTPQGWMRQWDSAGRVSFQLWHNAEYLLARANAAVMSIEDVQGDETLVHAYAQMGHILVITRGADGCTVFVDRTAYQIPAPITDVVDPTGAGDIFAATFFIRLHGTGDPIGAAHTATRVASASVRAVGLDGIPPRDAIEKEIS